MEKRFEVDGKEYFIKPADIRVSTEAQRVYVKAFKKAIEDGAILKKSLDDHMRRQGLWDDTKQNEYENLIKKMADIEHRIKAGQFKKASELKAKSLELKKIRNDLSSLLLTRNSMDSLTADGLADNERFNYLVSACVYSYDTQKPEFSSLEDYKARGDSELGRKAASEYANFAFGLDEDYEEKFVENKVLKRLNLINEKGQLINSDGKLVDEEGNFINENGSRVDKEGNRVDINNNPIIDDSVIDTLEFEDDLTP